MCTPGLANPGRPSRTDGQGDYDAAVEAVDHFDLVVTSLERSLAFYRGLLEPLGWVRTSEIEGERGERVVYLGRIGGKGSVSLRAVQSDAHEVPYDRYAIGLHHLALAADSREVVDERAAWLRKHGATIESGPEEYGYTPGYYAVFFHDPDGIKLELLHRPSRRLELARASYGAYESGDKQAVEELLTDDFTFYSPPDPGLDRAAYFERCWPNSEALESFEFTRLVESGAEVFVTYEATRTDGSRFRNTEVLTFRGDQISRAEVYFGWDLD